MRYLTKDELAKVLRVALKASRRDHLMILLAAQHGLRRSEVVALTWTDVDNDSITVRRLKGSDTTTHPLLRNHSVLFDEPTALAYFHAEREDDGSLLFPMTDGQFARIVKAHFIAAGISPELAHPHSLKHYCCAHLCRNGMGVEFVRVFVGHRDIKNTCRYLGISDEEASAKAQEAFQ